MPYLITTSRTITQRPGTNDLGQSFEQVTRRAVATLDEARGWIGESATSAAVASGRPRGTATVLGAVAEMREQGGTVGPLPDGTTITVEHLAGEAGWIELANRALLNDERRHDNAAIVAAFNAAQES